MTDKHSTEFDENQMTADSYKRIGTQLKTARREHGFRLSDVARELRISGDYLKLLESGEFDQLPAPTYVSGFLRSYGKFVGLDGAELASRFYALQDHASSKMDYKLPATAAPPQRSAPAVASLCVVLAIGVYGGWYWFSGPKTLDATVESELAAVELDSSRPGMMEKNATNEAFESNSVTTAGMQPDEAETGLAPSIDTAPAAADRLLAADAPSAPGTTVQSVSPATLTQPDSSAADDTVQTGAVDTASVATKPAVEADTATAAVSERPADAPQTTEMASRGTSASVISDGAISGSANSGSVTSDRSVMSDDTLPAGRGAAVATMRDPAQEITIRAIASSWVEIVRGDGTTVLKKLMRAGDIYIVDDSSGLYLSTGNAGGIEILSGENEIITIGSVGEIVRDLPLAKNRLRDRF
ncbi:MAG: helix-turn-helix domain-containing protein [Candidatus Puniceispirillaceae bacterium]